MAEQPDETEPLSSFDRFDGTSQTHLSEAPPEERDFKDFLILHGSEKYVILRTTLSSQDVGTITVQELKMKVEEVSGVNVNAQRLIYKGKSLTELDAALSTYGINSGSKIMLLGNRPDLQYESEEFRAVIQVEKQLSKLDQQLQKVDECVDNLGKGFLPFDLHMESLRKVEVDCHGLGETFMKLLENLDAVELSTEQAEVRLKRKSVVERIQTLLKKSDGITEQIQHMIAEKEK